MTEPKADEAPEPKPEPTPEPKTDQPPDFDADFEAEHAHFRKHMDRYFGDLERIVDAEPVGGPERKPESGRPAPAAGGEPKAAKPAKAPEVPPISPGPAARSWRDTLFGVSKTRR